MAEIIIRAHDNREVNGVLEYQELKQWILEGSTLSPKERTTYRDLGENERLMTIFLEKVIQQSTYEAVSLEEEEDNQAQHAKRMLLLAEDGGKQTGAKGGVAAVGVEAGGGGGGGNTADTIVEGYVLRRSIGDSIHARVLCRSYSTRQSSLRVSWVVQG